MAQLHHFSDASQCGYGTVSYLRLEDENKRVRLSFRLGKSRVAPLNQITIPRLELAAVHLAARIDTMLKKELQLYLEKSIFWTDSQTVLKYIANDAKRFHTFVANRVSVIRDTTEVVQWRHIGTKLNPADDASRGMSIEHFLKSSRWIQSPNFLLEASEEWPQYSFDRALIDDPEVKKYIVVNAAISNCSDSATHQLLNFFSDWTKLKTAVAWILKFKGILLKLKQFRTHIQSSGTNNSKVEQDRINEEMRRFRTGFQGQSLTPDDLSQAESVIIGFSQHDAFKQEISSLQSATSGVKRCSNIYKLDPVLIDVYLEWVEDLVEQQCLRRQKDLLSCRKNIPYPNLYCNMFIEN